MLFRQLPLLLILTASLFACGASEQSSVASSQPVANAVEDQDVKPANLPMPDGKAFKPVGKVAIAEFSTPETVPADWRKIAADQLVILKTKHGSTLIELATDFAPGHTERFRKFAREGYFKGLPFHRVLDGFMAQAGDPNLVGRAQPTTPNLQAEFTFRRDPSTKMVVTGERRAADAGFIGGFKVASQNPGLAEMTADGKVEGWGLHCPGAASSARLGHDVHSANAQFFITTSYPENLDRGYTIWGKVRAGMPSIYRIKQGEPPFPPDLIEMFVLAEDLSDQQPQVWVMNTDSAAFGAYLDSKRNSAGALPDVCSIDVPVLVRWP